MLLSPQILSSRLLKLLVNSNINSGQSAGVERGKKYVRIMEVDTISIRPIQLNQVSVHFTHSSESP